MPNTVHNQRVAVGEALRAGQDGGVEVGGSFGGVCPCKLVGGIGCVVGAAVAVAVGGGSELVYGRVESPVAGELVSVVEQQDVAGAGQSGQYPAGMMLSEEALVGGCSMPICAWVAPSVEQVAAHAGVAAAVSARLFGGCAVVYYP